MSEEISPLHEYPQREIRDWSVTWWKTFCCSEFQYFPPGQPSVAGEEEGLFFWGVHHNLGAEPLIFWQIKKLRFLQLDEQKTAQELGVHRVGAGLWTKQQLWTLLLRLPWSVSGHFNKPFMQHPVRHCLLFQPSFKQKCIINIWSGATLVSLGFFYIGVDHTDKCF